MFEVQTIVIKVGLNLLAQELLKLPLTESPIYAKDQCMQWLQVSVLKLMLEARLLKKTYQMLATIANYNPSWYCLASKICQVNILY